jgi:hypothetical protein
MQKNILLLCGLLSLATACAPKVRTKVSQKYPPLDYSEEVTVLERNAVSPAGAEVLGTVKIGDSGMSTQCNYAQVLQKAKEEARKAGGNAIKVVQHKKPDFMSSCHRIVAEVIKVDAGQLALIQKADEQIDSTLDHAVLYVYRNGGTGPLVGYNLYLGDSVLCRVTSRFKQEIKISKTGEVELWAKTESRAAVPIELKKGKIYYLRCSVGMGIMVGRPSLELVGRKTGSREYETVKIKSK